MAQLAGYVSEHSAYHHGEASLQQTIIGLAQDFVGSNNINLLFPSGQFGTRLQGGKDAASARWALPRLCFRAAALRLLLVDGAGWRELATGVLLVHLSPTYPYRVHTPPRILPPTHSHATPRYVYTRLAPLTRHLFNAADDKLLDYLNEEGQSIEPSWCVWMRSVFVRSGGRQMTGCWTS